MTDIGGTRSCWMRTSWLWRWNLMVNTQPQQCDICFQPYGPFFTIRILPVTPVISLSGTATPIHVRIPGARKIICHHCRQSYSNIEPWTEPEISPFATPPQEETADPLPASTAPTEYDNNQPAHIGQDCMAALPIISPMSATCLPDAIMQRGQLERDHCVPLSLSRMISLFNYCNYCKFLLHHPISVCS